ncbi:hypothetical protein D3C81_1916860 [compost metagenome]
MNTGWLRMADWRSRAAGRRLATLAASSAKEGRAWPSAKIAQSASTSAWVVVSSRDRPTRLPSTSRRLMRWARAFSCNSAVFAPVARVRVSKKPSCSTVIPSFASPWARMAVSWCTRRAMRVRPCGPW